MVERLVILGSSDRPDVYFNIIAHNAKTGTRQFVIALVGDDRSDLAARAQELHENLTELVKLLRAGRYATFRAGFGLTAAEALAEPAPVKGLLEKIAWGRLAFTHEAVQESELKTFLRGHASSGAAFDVTACGNSALAGAVAWLVSRGGSTIYSFEQLKAPTFGERDLLPYLGQDDYRYRDLSRGALILGATRRINAGTLRKQTFWVLTLIAALGVALLASVVPPALSGPLITGAATVATIMSAMAIVVRNPDS